MVSGLSNKVYMNDIAEIKEFIMAYPYETKDDAMICLNYLTKMIGEQYLDNRAEFIQKYFENDIDFLNLLSNAASLCVNEQCDDCPINKYCNSYIEKARMTSKENSLKMIDLFCGAGGLSLGFTQEGFEISLANDIMDCCVDTYAHNHPEVPRKHIVLGDINKLIENIDELLRYKEVDLIVGGPPCQGFSMANRQRIIDDPRNILYRSYVEIVRKIQPRFFVMENVKGMLSVVNQVKEDFESVGYSVSARILNAKDYGVPQNRERLIYIGNRLGVDNDMLFDEIVEYSKHIEKTVLEDALYGLQPLKALRVKNATELNTDESGRRIALGTMKTNAYIDLINNQKQIHTVANHKARYNNDRDIEIFSRLNPGDKSDDPKIADIMPYARRNDIFKDKYFKLENDKVCKTITAHMKFDCNMYIHPEQARGLTPREAARVQSFPDDYYFRGAYTKTYMQIGNSVPPLLGRAIAKVIKKYI